MLIPRSFNSRVQVIGANAGKLARVSYNPQAPGKVHEMVAEMDTTNEVAALRTMTYSLTQFTENNFQGEALLISFRAPVLRGWEIMKLTKAGTDPRTVMLKEWMYGDDANTDLVQALDEFIDAYEACTAKVSFALIRNAYVWDIEAGGQQIPDGAFLVFDPITNEATKYIVKTVDEEGTVIETATELEIPVTAEIKLKGEYKVTNYSGRTAVVRPNNSKEMLDVLSAISRVKSHVPEVSVENAEVITGTDGF